MNGLSLCAGVGGLDLGVEIAFPEYKCIAAVENNKEAAERFALRFPQAKIFRDVLDFDGRPFYGLVDYVCAGWPCFVTGTMVLTAAGYRPIEDVLVGDLVLTHTGHWRSVTAVMRRDDAPLVSLRGGGTLPTACTPEHPYYALRRTLRWDNERRRYVNGYCGPAWLPAGDLSTNHLTCRVLPQVEEDDHAPEFWWLVGRYLADGWRVPRLKTGSGNPVSYDQGRVVICAGKHKAAELRERIGAAGFRTAAVSRERTVDKFHIVEQSFYRFLEQFGKYAHGKTLPRRALTLNRDRAAALLDGLFSGDGCIDERGTRTLSTCSQSLALGAALLVQRAWGTVASISKHQREGHIAEIEGRRYPERDYYTVKAYLHNRSAFVDGNCGWSLLRRVEREQGTATVYNLSVEEDESYHANGSCVHNCQPHSVAGKRKGTSDERWIWDDIARILAECGAPLFFGENVSGLLRDADSDLGAQPDLDEFPDDAIGGMGTVLRDLAALGRVSAWLSLRASDVGAAHGRPRVFVLSVADDYLRGRRKLRPAFDYRRRDASRHVADGRDQRILADGADGGLGIDGSAPRLRGHADLENGELADAGRDRLVWGAPQNPGAWALDPGHSVRRPPWSEPPSCGGTLADAGSRLGRETGRLSEPELLEERGRDAGTGGAGLCGPAVADAQCARRAGSERPGLRSPGPALQAARPEYGGGQVADAQCAGRPEHEEHPDAHGRTGPGRAGAAMADACGEPSAEGRSAGAGEAPGGRAHARPAGPDVSLADAPYPGPPPAGTAGGPPAAATLPHGPDHAVDDAPDAQRRPQDLAGDGRDEGRDAGRQAPGSPGSPGGILEHAHVERLQERGRRAGGNGAHPGGDAQPERSEAEEPSLQLADAGSGGGRRVEGEQPRGGRLAPHLDQAVDAAGTVGDAQSGDGEARGSLVRPRETQHRGTGGSVRGPVADAPRPAIQAGGGRPGRGRGVRETGGEVADAQSLRLAGRPAADYQSGDGNAGAPREDGDVRSQPGGRGGPDLADAQILGPQGSGARRIEESAAHGGPELPLRPDRDVADAQRPSGGRLPDPPLGPENGRTTVDGSGADVADAQEPVPRRPEGERSPAWTDSGRGGANLPLFAPGPSDPRWPSILRARPDLAPALSAVEVFLALALQQGTVDFSQETEPRFRGLASRVAAWLHQRRPRLQACGNGVVCTQAAASFIVLAHRLGILEGMND